MKYLILLLLLCGCNLHKKPKVEECYQAKDNSLFIKITKILNYGVKVTYRKNTMFSDEIGSGYVSFNNLKDNFKQIDCLGDLE